MNPKDKVQTDLQTAMKEKDSVRRETLRTLLTSLTNAEMEKKDALNEEEFVQIVQRESKKRREAIEAFEAGGRQDRAQKEAQELDVLKAYLPKQLSEDEITAVVRELIESAPTTPNMGQLMGQAMGRLKGQANGNTVRSIVTRLLEQ